MFRFKKGELTMQQIVMIIILVASFAVILFFLIRLDLGGQTAQDVCHNSVVARGSSVIPNSALPLKCQREYVCLSASGSCNSMTNPTIIKVKTKNEVYHALAEQMATCWWEFGEGKVNYVGSNIKPKNYCSICSQIAFDPSVSKQIFGGSQNFSKKDFYTYLANTKMSSGETYLNYFLLNGVLKYNGNFGVYNMGKEYYSLIGITSDISKWGWVIRIGGGAAILAGTVALLPIGGVSAGLSGSAISALVFGAGGGTAAYFLAPTVKGPSGNNYIPPSLIQVNSPEFKALNCSSIVTSS